uniref:REPA_OB_2 domain-containing protein n=1 Tax=Macrostomum lignano TaxID=282301 RepID=A0A1I8JGI5_9PLAT
MASTITKKIKAKISGLKLGYMNAAVTGLVTDLKEIRSYMKNDVRGEVFSFVLVDDSAEMRVSVFGKDLRSIWEVCNTSDAVRIAGGMVKTSDPRYNSTNNPMEVSLSVDSKGSIFRSNEVPTVSERACNYTRISDLQNVRLQENVDVLGAIDTLQPPEEVMTKAGKRINVAKVTIVDQSCRSVSCTFWGSSSDQAVNWSVGDILSIRRAKVQEYAGAVVLGCTCSEVRLNSDDTEVTTLTDWYTNAKQSDTEFQPLGAPCPSGAVGGSSDQRGSNRRVVMQLPVSHESFRDIDEIVLDFGEGIKKLYRLVPSGESQFESTRIDWSTQADETSRMSCEDFSGSSRNQ